MSPSTVRLVCERAYAAFHHERYISPDPLEIVRRYTSPRDREVVGLVASCLALGRVDGILKAIEDALARLSAIDDSPARALEAADEAELRRVCAGFRYRFFDDAQLAGLLRGISSVVRRFGTLEACVAGGSSAGAATPTDERLIAGLARLVDEVRRGADGALDDSILLADPHRGSACKRLFLFARWMVRRDSIDPGGWQALRPSDLLVPVDTHVLKVARTLGLTRRNQASLLVSREVTAAMRGLAPDDPVRYDFALTRPGIHPLLDESAWLAAPAYTIDRILDTLVGKFQFRNLPEKEQTNAEVRV